ncbi:hypothetical protein E8E14_002884 [Neopestalotiopsis sp. 37M]|nr:hypothetical protein E8E14_002884 [Neopestalotiopsis sp. 37M]
MKNLTFTRVASLLAMVPGIVSAQDTSDFTLSTTTETYSDGRVSTYTLNGLTTTIIIGATVEGEQPQTTPTALIDTVPPPGPTGQPFPFGWTYTMIQDPTTVTITQHATTFLDPHGQTRSVPDATVTETFPAETYTTTIYPLVDPTPFPPGSPPANDKRDYTYTTYWTETLTETLSIPAVTFSLTTTTQTLPPETFTNTWTRIVTTHVTVTEPTPTTLATLVTQTVTN